MLTVYKLENSEIWDKIVKGFNNYDVYYLSGYAKAFKLNGDGEPNLFYYEDSYIKAINVVMLRDIGMDKHFVGKIPANTYYDLSTPYGYGGFLVEGDISQESINNLNIEYSNFCINKRIISEFVRFHPVLNNSIQVKDVYDVALLGKTVVIDLSSSDLIWDNFVSQNRNKIRKAQRAGVKICWGQDTDLYNEFIKIYNKTMDRNNAESYYYFKDYFYESIHTDLKYNSLMFYAVYQGKIIAMSIMLFANNQMHYHLSASDEDYLNIAPTNLLLYEAACWGCANGLKTLHLGGGVGGHEDSLYKFKSNFNKNSDASFCIGKKIFDKKIYNELVNIRYSCGDITQSNYFPLYKAK